MKNVGAPTVLVFFEGLQEQKFKAMQHCLGATSGST